MSKLYTSSIASGNEKCVKTDRDWETINFTIYNDITRGGSLDEGVSLSSKSMSADQKSIQIKEWGNAIKVSEKLLRLSWDDVMAESATLLGRDYAA